MLGFRKKSKEVEIKVEQSFFARAIVNYLRPTYYLKDISDIDLLSLWNSGLKAIVCDLDNTLAPHFLGVPKKDTLNFIREAKSIGFKFFVFSNNTEHRVESFIKKIPAIDGYVYSAKKPFIRKFNKLISDNNLVKSEIVMIGDQLEMDILCANISKVESILVEPKIDSSYDLSWWSKVVENFIYKRLARFNTLSKGTYDSMDTANKYRIL